MDEEQIQTYGEISYSPVDPQHWDVTWEEILEILDRRYCLTGKVLVL